MPTLTKKIQQEITPTKAIEMLQEGNKRFLTNLKVNRNMLKQINETIDGQHPFAVIISCMDSRTSAELIFDQGLGDILSVRVAGNVINEDILASAEFGCKVVGAKIIVVLGHTSCGAIQGAVDNVDLGHFHFISHKIQRCIPEAHRLNNEGSTLGLINVTTRQNVLLGMQDLRTRSSILAQMEHNKEIGIIGGVYDVSTGVVSFIKNNELNSK